MADLNFNWPAGSLWQHQVVYTKTQDATSQNVEATVTLAPGTYGILEQISFGPDDYAAGRSLLAYVTSDVSTFVERLFNLLLNTSVDNAQLFGPRPLENHNNTATSTVINNVGIPQTPYVMHSLTPLFLQAIGLVDDETLTILMQMRIIGGEKPTVALTDATDITTATAFDRFIP